MGDTKGKSPVSAKTTKGGGGSGRGKEHSSSEWKTARVPYGKGTYKDGGLVYKQKDIRYRLHTNIAGIQQCKRQSGEIAVLLGTEKAFTSRFRTSNSRRGATEKEFQERMKKAEEKRLSMLFCPELVEITLDPTLSRENRLGRFHKFIEENYPEDIYDDGAGGYDMLPVGYGVRVDYREPKPGETAENVPKYCTLRDGLFLELTFDLRVEWIKPWTKFKIMENDEYGIEYLITDEDFDVV